MYRLTKNYPEHAAVLCENCDKECKSCGASDCLRVVAKRLADIEDILGDTYDLDRLRELVEADKQGRCVVIPCKYGERVYCVYHKRETHFGCAHCFANYGMGVACDYYNAETDTCENNPAKYKNYEIISKHFEAGMIPNFGKTVFKNRKDAESALEILERKLYHE